MDNAEEIFHFLEEFSKRKTKNIPQQLNEYLAYVARTGDPVYQWSLVKSLFKEKLLDVITDFYETSPGIDIPPYPNVDPFNYDIMKNSLLERLDSFTSAPFTVQRICELLTCPRKQYNRVDKFMRAIEKNILVVSTREPGPQRYPEPENGEANEPIVNGSDNNSEYNVDVEMEDMSWKENAENQKEPQPGSSDAHISVDEIEARLKAKQEASMEIQEKLTTQYESVTPPELNINADEVPEKSESECSPQPTTSTVEEENKTETTTDVADTDNALVEESKEDIEMKPEPSTAALIIPEIKVDDTEMTELKLNEQSSNVDKSDSTDTDPVEKETINAETKVEMETQPTIMDESSSDSASKEESETKLILDENSSDSASKEESETKLILDESSSDSISKEEPETKLISEVSTSSEESSSSSDNTDGNSNSPKAPEQHIDLLEEVSQPETKLEEKQTEEPPETIPETIPETKTEEPAPAKIESDNYSISDVNSELPQPPADIVKEDLPEEKKEITPETEKVEEPKAENDEVNTESKDS